MSATLTVPEVDIFTALRGVLGTFGFRSSAPGQGVPIIRGQVNRVPPPKTPDFVVMWPIGRPRLSTNFDQDIDAQIIGFINQNRLFVTEIIKGSIGLGLQIYSENVPYGVTILDQPDGVAGDVGTYCISESPNVSSQIMYIGSHNVTEPTEMIIQCDVHGPNSGNNVQRLTSLFRDQFSVTQFQRQGLGVTPLYADDPHQIPFFNEDEQFEERWSVDIHMQINTVTTVTQDFADQLKIKTIEVEATYLP